MGAWPSNVWSNQCLLCVVSAGLQEEVLILNASVSYVTEKSKICLSVAVPYNFVNTNMLL